MAAPIQGASANGLKNTGNESLRTKPSPSALKSGLFGARQGKDRTIESQIACKTPTQKAIGRLARNIVAQAAPSIYQNGTPDPLNVCFVSAEVAPWSKTGGLGDVVGGLPIELARRGHRVMTIAPRYDQYSDLWDTSVTTNVDGEEVRYFHTIQDGVDRVFVDHPWFLAKVWGKTGGKLYGTKAGADYVDNQRRFMMFNKAALRALDLMPFGPGPKSVVVANDWHTAVLPLLVKEVYQKNGQYKDMKTALCIHNIAFQGRFWRDSWRELSLPERVKTFFEFEDGMPKVFVENEPVDMIPQMAPGSTFQKLNWLRAGVLTSDKLLTVSPNYATEISEDDEKGVELSGAIRAAGGLEGIVNGIDVTEWSPFLDKYLDVKYDVNTMDEGKAVAKETLQAELGFQVNRGIPLYGFIGRLEEQKGVDILIAALPEIARTGGVQIAILGTGKKSFEQQVLELDKKFPEAVKGVVKFDAPLAHLITAGADFMLVPSRFEPCGLIQLHAMNYGTVPVVASTGGLVDTVKEGVTGFHAGRFNPDKLEQKDASALAGTIRRSAGVFHTEQFRQMRKRCIVQDLSWEIPGRKWESVLREMRHQPSHPSVHYSVTRGSASGGPQSTYRNVGQKEERKGTYPTPVQTVNNEGDGVNAGQIARKSAASQAVRERPKPQGFGPAGPRPAGAGARPAGTRRGSAATPIGPAKKTGGTSKPAGTNGSSPRSSSSSNGNGAGKTQESGQRLSNFPRN